MLQAQTGLWTFSSFGNWDLETGGEVEEWLCGQINPFLCPVKGGRGTFYSTLVIHKHNETEKESVYIQKIQKHRAAVPFLQKKAGRIKALALV